MYVMFGKFYSRKAKLINTWKSFTVAHQLMGNDLLISQVHDTHSYLWNSSYMFKSWRRYESSLLARSLNKRN